ncbi:reverse transcriptase/maturase family protein [Bacillus sp. SM2101]|uniref:reverse transcriptase/maturase family protein n=1 Tax=Bacillus sp. SM2101 TaxID=2805366 RepID=UPI001BDE4EBC|nr:reverse transcriptase/maturase family protein [Bacillus sp. SM2101]
MRNPTVVLNNLTKKSREQTYTFKRLYRNLYNREFYLKAYQKIYANEGNMTSGTDGKTVDGMSLERIDKIIDSIKTQSFKPNPAKRTYIPKSNGGKRPLGIPSSDDKLVQEVLRDILEAIYEPRFSDKSHGFRPKKSCHSALLQTKAIFNGTKWFVEGDIKGFFDNIHHHTLISILRKTIKDEKVINLIWKFLKAGYLEDWKFHKSFSGTPQGGIISPILSNIYLNELDEFMNRYKEEFDKGVKRTKNPQYFRIYKRIYTIRKVLDKSNLTDKKRKDYLTITKALYKELGKHDRTNPMDANYRRINYVRYADDFIISINGNKKDAEKVKADLTVFLKENLSLELSQEKTLITHNTKKARFLGYDIKISQDKSFQRNREWKSNHPKRSVKGKCFLLMPTEKWIKKLLEMKALKIDENGKWQSTHRTYLAHLDDLEILSVYNSEVTGLYNYYKLADNVSNLHRFLHIMKYSMFKTFGNKYKTSVPKVIDKYYENGVFVIAYETKKGTRCREFYNKGFYKSVTPLNTKVDELPNTLIYSSRNSLIKRLLANKCEWCGKENVPIEIHHVKKVKDLKGKKRWEQIMIARKRKTLAMCVPCHKKLHAGKLD